MSTKTNMTTEQFDLVILSIIEMAIRVDEGREVLDRLFPIVLDYAGIPEDTSSEACEIAYSTGEYPEGYYCRDFWCERWGKMEDGEISPVEFLLECRREVASLQGSKP